MNHSNPINLDPIQSEQLKRQEGLISKNIINKSILGIGLGGGAQFIIDLCKHGVSTVTAIDFDNTEIHNTARTAYGFADGLQNRPKVECLNDLIIQHAPFTDYYGINASYCELSDDERRSLIQNADLVIYTADSFEAAKLLNEDILRYGCPAIFIGIHHNGFSGRIIPVIPGVTPCYRCIAHDRYEAEANQEVVDLAGESCTLADVKFIDAIALKVALAILERDEDSAYGEFGRRLIESQRHEIIVRTDPIQGFGNDLWDALLGDLPDSPKAYASELKEAALFAMDSIWLKSSPREDCQCCFRETTIEPDNAL